MSNPTESGSSSPDQSDPISGAEINPSDPSSFAEPTPGSSSPGQPTLDSSDPEQPAHWQPPEPSHPISFDPPPSPSPTPPPPVVPQPNRSHQTQQPPVSDEMTSGPVTQAVPGENTHSQTSERPHPLTGVARSWIALFGLIVIFGREFAEQGLEAIYQLGPGMWFLLIGVVGVVVVTLIWGVLEWLTTRFVADQTEFRIDRNLISKESTRISYAKIQSVEITRTLAARILGLAGVQIDVGGAGGAKLEFLSNARAEALRDQLLARMRLLSDPDGGTEAGNSPAAVSGGEGVQPPALEEHVIVAVSPKTLLLGALVSWALPSVLIALAIIGSTIFFEPALGIATLGVVIGLVSFLWRQIVGNWGFTVTRVRDGLRISRGLFTKVSNSLKPDRIQAVSIHQDLLQRLTKLYRVQVTVLGMAEADPDQQSSSTVLAYGTWEDVTRTLAAFWPGIDLAQIQLNPQPARARWLTPLGFKQHSWGIDDQSILAHHGWLDHTISLVPHRRMQSLGLQQGPLQRRLRLAGLKIHTTNGPVNLRLYHLDEVQARELFEEQRRRAKLARESKGEPGYLVTLPPPTSTSRTNYPQNQDPTVTFQPTCGEVPLGPDQTRH